MESLSAEEENYVRMSLLLTGISPCAVRTYFDYEFAPTNLEASLKREYNTLFDLKRQHIINQSQLDLLFPRFPDVPLSKNFDVTLMTTLLRHLTPMNPPTCGFDRLPSAIETTPAADLARIKHYRNNIAHLNDGKIDISVFNFAWDDITNAIIRLGGEQLKQQCDQMRTKTLDQTNQVIMIDIEHSKNEIRDLKESFKSLKLSHSEMKKYHEILQENHAVVAREMGEINNSQKDTVPWNVRVRITDTLKTWKDNDDKMFINTRAAQYVLKNIQDNACVTITASSGVGKTSILRHTAVQLAAEDYDVILVTEPIDIVRFYNPNIKTLFVIDDLCGNFSIDQSDIKSWEPIMDDINQILDKKTKILAACRLQVYQDDKFDSLSVFKSCVCNILSESICLSKNEKHSIAKLYVKTKASEIGDFYDLYDCFPLLCKLCYDNPELNVTDFFQNPFLVYEAEIDNLFKKGHYTKYCALALCVMFNNELNEKLLTEKMDDITKAIFENTCEACKLDRGTSRLVLQNELDLLAHTFIKKENNVYKTMHDKIFDFLAYYFGQKLVHCLIKNADNGLIKQRFLLEKKDDMDSFSTVIPPTYHQMYIQRMVDDWSMGQVQDVFNNTNMNIPQFRNKFLSYLELLDIFHQKNLANTCDKRKPCKRNDNTYNTAVLHCCYIGDISLIEWCCSHGVDVNKCSYHGQSPIMIGCEQGHTEIVLMLLERRADYNKCNRHGQSPVMVACAHGHTDIVKILLHRGVDCNECDKLGRSPLMKACEQGHTQIVNMVLDSGADCNKCDWSGQSPVMKACEHGHTEIVKLLLDRGADCNKFDTLNQSPLVKACENGHTNLVRMLLHRGVDCTICYSFCQSTIMDAHKQVHTEIVNMLMERAAELNKCGLGDQSPLMKACKQGDTEIVMMLLDKEADFSLSDSLGQSPVMTACVHGHTKIVRILLDRGADYNKFDDMSRSPLMMASENGHTEIVIMLLDRGAFYNNHDERYESPVMKACEHGHTKIVKILLDRGADYNKFDDKNRTPLMKACKNGHTEIVMLLLDSGAAYNNHDKQYQSPVMKACEHGHSKNSKDTFGQRSRLQDM